MRFHACIWKLKPFRNAHSTILGSNFSRIKFYPLTKMVVAKNIPKTYIVMLF